MRENTSKGDGGTDKGVELLVTTDSELQMAGRDTLDLEILGRVSCQFEDLGSEVFQYGG